MDLENISAELKEKARACKTPEELLALAAAEGIELTEEQLNAVAGGVSWDCIRDCPDHQPCPQDR